MSKVIASCLGIGYLKGGGTIAAAFLALLIYISWRLPQLHYQWYFLAITLLITVSGIYVGNRVEGDWGKDSSRVVIDEGAGMMISVLFLPHKVSLLIAALVLFRFFDIIKPLYIRKMEALPGGTGVMMDDILAGVYSNILLQAAVILFKI